MFGKHALGFSVLGSSSGGHVLTARVTFMLETFLSLLTLSWPMEQTCIQHLLCAKNEGPRPFPAAGARHTQGHTHCELQMPLVRAGPGAFAPTVKQWAHARHGLGLQRRPRPRRGRWHPEVFIWVGFSGLAGGGRQLADT